MSKGGAVTGGERDQTAGDARPLAIPVRVELGSRETVLCQPEMEELLAGADGIAVGECGCRKKSGACDNPRDVCLALGDEARDNVERNGWRPIEVSAALAVLEATHRAGLVHLAFRKPDGTVNLVCSCCSCCCEFLGQLTRSEPQADVVAAAYVARFDASRCTDCGLCVSRCKFGAFSRSEGTGVVRFEPERCLGCGLCASACPGGAVELVRRTTA